MKNIEINTRSISRQKRMPLIIVYVAMILLFIIANFVSPGFISAEHLQNVGRQAAFLGIACIGQTLVILIGGIDMSMSTLITFANIVSADIIIGRDENTFAAFLAIVLIGAVVGLLNGAGIYFLRIPPIVMTLAMGSVINGASYIYSNGAPKGNTSPILDSFSNGRLFDVINGVTLLWLVLGLLIILLLRYSVFGRSVYAIGNNREAARYSGLKVSVTTISVFMISSVLAAITGMLLLGYTGTSYIGIGSTYNMNTIAAVVVGGTDITGGRGSYFGTMAGALIMTVITSIMTMINMPESGRQIAQGVILIILLLVVYGREKNKT